MKKKKFLKVVFVICFVVSIFLFLKYYVHDSEPVRVKLANQVNEKTAKNIYKKNKLRCTETGGTMTNDVEMMRMSLNTKEELDIPKCRKLIIECIDEYLKNINSDEKIRPHLHKFPFNEENIELSISGAVNKEFPTHFNKVVIRKGDIRYDIACSDKNNIISHEETYQEAVAELNKEHVAEFIEKENKPRLEEEKLF